MEYGTRKIVGESIATQRMRGGQAAKPATWDGIMVIAIVVALCGSAAMARAQQGGGNMKAMRQACAADFKTFCSGVQPGGGRIRACLQQNAAKLSPGCQTALNGAH